MKKIELNIYKLKEKEPNDGQQCWVSQVNGYPQVLTYNDYEKCWDDEEGDDYFCDLNEDDVWMELPDKLD